MTRRKSKLSPAARRATTKGPEDGPPAFPARWKKTVGFLTAAFGVVTSVFWFWLCQGSWRDEDRPAATSNGCLEFDLRAKIKGQLYSPNPLVVTRYSDGYVLLNWASFDFEGIRGGTSTEKGVAYMWINPFTMSLSLHYKIQAIGDFPQGGHRETAGLRFRWNREPCPAK
jgi:hypothetical protein